MNFSKSLSKGSNLNQWLFHNSPNICILSDHLFFSDVLKKLNSVSMHMSLCTYLRVKDVHHSKISAHWHWFSWYWKKFVVWIVPTVEWREVERGVALASSTFNISVENEFAVCTPASMCIVPVQVNIEQITGQSISKTTTLWKFWLYFDKFHWEQTIRMFNYW